MLVLARFRSRAQAIRVHSKLTGTFCLSQEFAEIISQGEKIHVVMRRSYEGQVRRHFVGQAEAVSGAIVRATGYVFIYDEMKAQYIRKDASRTTIMNLAGSGYIVNMVPPSVKLEDLRYETIDRTFLAITDGKGFMLDINEFGTKR